MNDPYLPHPKAFQATLDQLRQRIAPLPEDPTWIFATYVDPDDYEAIDHLLKAAQIAAEKEHFEAAWFYLVEAASEIGFHRGIREANFSNSPEQGVVALLKERGRSGGEAKGRNSELKREALARALINAAPKGKWASKEKFEDAFHKLSKTIPGFYASNHQLRKLMQRDDIKATLAPRPKRVR